MTVRIKIEAPTAAEALKEMRELTGANLLMVTPKEESQVDHEHPPQAKAEIVEHVVPEPTVGQAFRAAEKMMANDLPAVLTPTPPAAPSAPIEPMLTIHDGPPPPAVEVDSRGIPWDARVHAGNKATSKKDGSWKKRRNVDPALHAKVEAELKATAVIPAIDALPTAAAPPPPPPATTEPPPVNFGKLLATANNDITVLDEAINTVSKGEFTTIAQVATLPAWIQAVYDHIS
jgi:hypothetical protein